MRRGHWQWRRLRRCGSSVTRVSRLGPTDLSQMRALNALFADAFDEPEQYAANLPDDAWLQRQLANPQTIVLVAEEGTEMVGGLVAYELPKLEQARSEIYIYDIAVAVAHRRTGVATALIAALQPIARACGAWVIYVQAGYGDEPAIALYTKLGAREDVMHVNIKVDPAAD
jgi:aminoglycoside 3-N-acetyltransferase I